MTGVGLRRPSRVVGIDHDSPCDLGALRERLIAKVVVEPGTGCWLWTGARTSSGYGHLSVGNRTVSAHRVAYQAFRGEVPGEMAVCHGCDARSCINPDHLWLGTPKERAADALRKGKRRTRKPKGTIKERINANSMPEPNSGCWLWLGPVDDWGYGRFFVDGSLRRAHRVAYKAHVGPIPDGMLVCHKCDVPSCVNPSHLFLGTPLDNNRDRHRKGRTVAPRGEASGVARLTADQARIAKYSTERFTVLAARFGVDPRTIAFIRYGRTWRHI